MAKKRATGEPEPPDEETGVTQASGEDAVTQDAGDKEADAGDAAADTSPAEASAAAEAVGADATTGVTEVVAPDKTEAATAVSAGANAATAAEGGGAEPAPARRRRGGRLHATLIAVLVVLSCLALVVTGVAWWAHYTVLNTDGYMKLVAPVGKDPAAIKALSDYVSSQVITATDLQGRAQSALPTQAQFLAGPITSAVESFIQKQVQKLLSTPQAYAMWLKINEVAHQQIVGLLRGQNTYTYIKGSDVKLNVLPLVSQALVWLQGKLPGALSSRISVPVIEPGTPPDQAIQQVEQWSGKTLPADFGQITLLTSNALGPAQTAIKIFDAIVIVLPIIVAALVALTIWLSHRRRTTIIALGIGAAVALIITHAVVKQAANAIVAHLQLGSVTTVVKDVVSSSLNPLTALTIWVVVIGAVVAFVAWFVGRRDLRTAVVNAGRTAASRTSEVAASDSPAILWMRHYAAYLRIAGLVVALILLLVVSGWALIIALIILLALYEVAVSYVTGDWPFPDRAPQAKAE